MSKIQQLTDEKARLVQQKSVLDTEIKRLEEEMTQSESTIIKNVSERAVACVARAADPCAVMPSMCVCTLIRCACVHMLMSCVG